MLLLMAGFMAHSVSAQLWTPEQKIYQIQNTFASPAVWEGGEWNDVAEVEEGEIYTIGTSENQAGSTATSAWICKLDRQGVPMQFTKWGNSTSNFTGHKIAVTQDGNLACLVYDGTHSYLLNLTPALTLNWARQIPNTLPQDVICVKTILGDGIYVLTGGGFQEYQIHGLDLSGTSIWSNIYYDIGLFLLSPEGLAYTKAGGFMVTGSGFNAVSGNFDMFLASVNDLGSQNWIQHYAAPAVDVLRGNAITTSHNPNLYTVAGNYGAPGFELSMMMEVDAAGNINWVNYYDDQQTTGLTMTDIAKSPNKEYMVSGFALQSSDFLGTALRVDQFGNGLDLHDYEPTSFPSDHNTLGGLTYLSAPDAGFFMVGRFESPSVPSPAQFESAWGIRTDDNGDTECAEGRGLSFLKPIIDIVPELNLQLTLPAPDPVNVPLRSFNTWDYRPCEIAKTHHTVAPETKDAWVETLGSAHTLHLRENAELQTSLTISNLEGKVLVSADVAKGTSTYPLNTTALANGMYVVRISQSNGQVRNWKIVVTR